MSPLILERASASRQSGQWRDDDYDVLEDGVVVGRIFKVQVALADKPWMWASGHNGDIRLARVLAQPTTDHCGRRRRSSRHSPGAAHMTGSGPRKRRDSRTPWRWQRVEVRS